MAQKMNIGTMFVELLLADEKFTPEMKKAEKALELFGGKLVDVAGKLDRIITRAFQTAAAAVMGLGTAAAVTGAAFEKQMSRVAAVSGATTTEMKLLTDEARRIGSVTMFSASEAAQGMEALAQAGFTPRQIIAATADAMALAGASGMELSAATEVVAATLTQFGLRAEDAGRASDVLTQAASASLFTVQDLGVALRYAGSVGASMGMSLEQTTAALAQFRNMGLTGEQAGTNFRGMLESLANPTLKARETIDSLGLSVNDLNPTMRSFDEIMQTLADHNLGVADSFKIFGTVSGANVARLANTWEDAKTKQTGYAQTLEALMTSQGVAAAQFGMMADNVAGRFDTLSSSIEEGLLTIFEAMKGPLSRLLDELTTRVGFLTRQFQSASGEVQDGLDRVVDGVLTLVDQLIILSPYIEEIGALMFAALVGAKGVQWAGALAGLAKAFGFDLAAAAAKAATSITAASAASAAFTATGVGAVLAGLALLALAVGKVWTQYTGATRAARELAGEIAGQQAMTAAGREALAAAEVALAAQKEELRFRIEYGEVLTDTEQRILRMSAAEALAAVAAGKLLEVDGEFVAASQLSADARRERITMLDAEAASVGSLANRLDFLAGQYTESGISDTLNDAIMSGLLAKASEVAGRSIGSLEELVAAQAELANQSTALRKTSAALAEGLVDETLAANEASLAHQGAAGSAYELASALDETETKLTTAEKAAAKWTEGMRDGIGEIAFNANAAIKVIEKMIAYMQNPIEGQFGNPLLGGMRESVVPDASAFKTMGQKYEGAITAGTAAGLVETLGSGSYAMKLAGSAFKGLMIDAGETLAKSITNALGTALRDLGDMISMKGLIPDASSLGKLVNPADLMSMMTGGLGSVSGVMGLLHSLTPTKTAGEAGTTAVNGVIDAAITFVDTVVAELPAVLQTITDRIPDVVDSLVAAIPKVVATLVKAIPDLVQAFATALPALVGTIAENLPILVRAIVDAIPVVITAILKEIPTLIMALAQSIAIIIRGLPEIISAVLKQLPTIIMALVRAIPVILDAVIEAVPEIVIAIADALPAIVVALAEAIPYLVGVIISRLPGIALALVKSLWELLKGLAKAFGALIVKGIPAALGLGKKDKNGERSGFLGGLFSGRGRHPDGIPWVPHTMATVLEPGEGVVDAVSNWERLRTNYGTPGPHPSGEGGGSTEVTVLFEGRVMDTAMARSRSDGRMPKTARAIRGTETRLGFNRGRGTVWG